MPVRRMQAAVQQLQQLTIYCCSPPPLSPCVLSAVLMAGAAGAAVVALIVLLSVRAAAGWSESYWTCPEDAMPARTPDTVTFYVVGS